jgi:sugar phosphate isomerase/epimerase
MTGLSVATWGFPIDSLDSVLKGTAAAGWDAIELDAFVHDESSTALAKASREALRAEIADHGLAISGVAGFPTRPNCVFDADPTEYMTEFSALLGYAADLGAPRLLVFSGDTEDLTDAEMREAAERMISVWTECSKRAGDLGLELSWEAAPGSACVKPEFVLEISERLAGGAFGVVYDTAHAHLTTSGVLDNYPRYEGGQARLISELAPMINHVHLADSDGSLTWTTDSVFTGGHVPLGVGDVDLDAAVEALVATGRVWDWWAVDLFGWQNPWMGRDPWSGAETSLAVATRLLQATKSDPVAPD